MELKEIEALFLRNKEQDLFGRYITSNIISNPLKRVAKKTSVVQIGNSEKGLPINFIQIGNGIKRILFWSQMHGNESTTTKAVFDLCNTLLNSEELFIEGVKSSCTIGIIPMLNPDGARLYTRNNANDIDLNRDAQSLSQLESQVLRKCFDSFKPDFCFNLHDQRTIFSAGKYPKPATISFLAPTQDEERSITKNRKDAMSIISGLNNLMSEIIPGCVGVYDDSFNINCVGDYFQSKGVPTILFEAGHFSNDYDREYTRYLIYACLLKSVELISNSSYQNIDYKNYFDIPQNEKLFLDVIIRSAKIKNEDNLVDLGFQFLEILKNQKIEFIPKLEKISGLEDYYGHHEIQANGNEVSGANGDSLRIGYLNDFVLNNYEITLLKSENNSIS
ncbi:Zinc carboxypeptidase [Flavobacteriaceae bacterium MAR_2010_188]|nr:Zinc carboxypeptidase [Flavobacteriaceae bacterium MAR_2010_188]